MFSNQQINLYAKTKIGVRSDGSLALQGHTSSWNGGGSLNLKASVINLNGAAAQSAGLVSTMVGYKLPNTIFVAGQGWVSQSGTLDTIVTRAPTHEPYESHNSGVNLTTNLDNQATSSNPPPTSNLQAQANTAYITTSATAVQQPLGANNFLAEPTSVLTVPAQ